VGKTAKWFYALYLTFLHSPDWSLQADQKLKIGINSTRNFSLLAMREHFENLESRDLLIFSDVRFQ
jgi:hypothetical protein